ncbi:hypothetical protein [Lysinibacillus sp. LZ02]
MSVGGRSICIRPISEGQQDVGHAGIVTRYGEPAFLSQLVGVSE